MTLYERLGVSPTATLTEILNAHRLLSLKHHPDRGGDPAVFGEIQVAFTVLSNTETRNRYDERGEINDPKADPVGEAAALKLREVLADVVQSVSRYEGEYKEYDLVEGLVENLKRQRLSAEMRLDLIAKGAAVMGDVSQRFEPIGSAESVLAGVCLALQRHLLEAGTEAKARLQVLDRALKIASTHHYRQGD